MQRVVVTGVGALTPLGIGIEDTWAGILAGRSGIKATSHIDCTKLRSKVCGRVWDYRPENFFEKKDARRQDLFIQYARVASKQAIIQAGLNHGLTEETLHRTGVIIGSGIGGLSTIEAECIKMHKFGPERVSPFLVPGAIINMASGAVAMDWGFKGQNISVVSACASGAHSVIQAAQSIALGDADIMLAGGSEHVSNSLGIAGFDAMRALSSAHNGTPEAASRPWDKARDGFVLSDGAAILVLESYDFAKARGASILAEIVGYGMTGDAYHMTQPDPLGDGATRCMTQAIRKAEIQPEDIDYINAHATSTPLGDLVEPVAIKAALGEHAYKIPISSTKSMTGHTLGAAGSLEAALCIYALRDQIVPGTINLDDPDEGCDLDFVNDGAREQRLDYVMTNSFGFGGTNASLLMKRWTE